MSDDQIPVPIGACQCPGAPHEDGDVVYLRPKLGLRPGVAIQRLLIDSQQSGTLAAADLAGLLAEGYLIHGVVAWSMVNETGKPVPVNEGTIRTVLLDDFERAAPVADAADDQYKGVVILPLVNRARASLKATLTNVSTSPVSNGSAKSPKRPRRSSTSTTQTVGIAATSA